MLLGALVDAGLSLEELRGELSKLPLTGYSIEASKAQRGVVSGTHVTVDLHADSKGIHTIHDFLDMVQASSLSGPVKD